MKNELKPCPFCGGKPFVSARLPYFGEKPTVAVVCENCNAASKHKVYEEDAIESWNRRKDNSEMKWIPVTERLPEIGGNYLVVVKYKYNFEKEYNYDVDFAEFTFSEGYIDNCWNTYNDWDEGQQHLHITHWMPLPEPPETIK